MYISTFTPLQSALSGIEVAQQELDTTSNNIGNADTPGYTEESVNLSAALPLTIAGPNGAGMQVGTGVDADSIASARSQYLDTSYRAQNGASNYASTEQTYINQAQSALDEPSTSGISTQLQTFWSSWNSLANNPNSTAAKQAVVSDGQALVSSIQQLNGELSPADPTDPSSVQSQATTQYNTLTGSGGQVESDAQAIATLYPEIQQATAAGENPNDLQDKYNQALDDLSSLANVSVQTDQTGTVSVYFGDASSPLVSVTSTGQSTVDWPQTLTSAAGGTLGALMDLTDDSTPGPIAGYQQQLNTFAQDLADSVNSLSPSQPFFTYDQSDDAAATLAVDPTVVSDPSQVQSSSTDGAAGDVAASISNLSGGEADQDYAGLVAMIGSGAQSADSNATMQQALSTAISNQRQSVEGVDLSQEETNVIQEQQAYQASAQVMNVFNTMINTLIEQVG